MSTDADVDRPTVRVRGPADLAQLVPYLLGFHPRRSLVLVGLAAGRVAVTARLDLSDVGPDAAAPANRVFLRDTVATLLRGGAGSVVGLVFDEDAGARAAGNASGRRLDDAIPALPHEDVAERLRAVAGELGVPVDDLLLVGNGRLWSYECREPSCCPPEGVPLAPDSAVAAEAIYAGMTALPDRDALARQLDPDPGRERLLAPLRVADVAGHPASTDASWTRSVTRALFAAARRQSRCDDADLVRFGSALRRVDVRDAAWIAIDGERLGGASAFWLQLARRLPAPYDAPALFLLGWGAYRRGDGVFAGIAGERALASDPDYSAADLLLAALARGVDPRQLARLRHPRGRLRAGSRAARPGAADRSRR